MVARTWNGGAAGVWALAANWLPAAIPGVGDTATIDRAGGATVTGNADIACDGIYVGQVNGSNILLVQNDLNVGALVVYNQALNKVELDGTTVGAIVAEMDTLDCRKSSGIVVKGPVNLHGPSYSAPLTLVATTVADYLSLDASANLEAWWLVDDKTAAFVITSGAKFRAWRGVQFTALTVWAIHVAGVKYDLNGSYASPQYTQGGVYVIKDRLGNRSAVDQTGRRPRVISWNGVIDDATYKFLKDEIEYWNSQGTELHVVTRDAIIKARITDCGWRPTGPDTKSFYYYIECTECD